MLDVAVIEDPAEVSLDPIRSRLLSELAGTVSALVGKYHDGTRRRDHRVIAAVHPSVNKPIETGTSETPAKEL
ncbi:MAG: hypothetical protein JWQ95_1256 [Sphaerisporangium sp.]|nr:hypothetical protein [Sphaerisporangium sp.]